MNLTVQNKRVKSAFGFYKIPGSSEPQIQTQKSRNTLSSRHCGFQIMCEYIGVTPDEYIGSEYIGSHLDMRYTKGTLLKA
jgi:hypothetical protein